MTTAGMLPHERLPFKGIDERPPLRFPKGIRTVVWPVLALEVWDISRPMARMIIPPPQGQPMLPDHPNWSWHEYGMRVGFWRIRRLFNKLCIRPTVTLNAHSYDQQPMHKLADQRETIFRSLDVIEKFSGTRPRGWFGPGLTQDFTTLDHLREAGLEYFGDWVCDDEPVNVKTAHGTIVAVPYNFELHDIVTMALQGHSSEETFTRAVKYFECIHGEGADRAKIMSMAHHNYLSGSPHRIADVARTYEYMLAKDGVITWDGSQILDWFKQQDAAQ